MLAIIEAAGWPIWPLIFASIIALGIIVERAWSLQREDRTTHLLGEIAQEVKHKGVTQDLLNRLSQGSLLARLFAVGLENVRSSREVMKESPRGRRPHRRSRAGALSDHARNHRPLAPIMGLFGTVIGMIEIFGAQGGPGMSTNPAQLHGISVALYNTCLRLLVAIPS